MGWLCFGIPCRFHTEARYVPFDDHTVMHEPIDGCGSRHRVSEDLVPVAESEVARQQHTPAFIAFRRERQQDFHLLATLLHLARTIDDQAFEGRQLFDHSRKTQIALRNQQLLHQLTARRKQPVASLKNYCSDNAVSAWLFPLPGCPKIRMFSRRSWKDPSRSDSI